MLLLKVLLKVLLLFLHINLLVVLHVLALGSVFVIAPTCYTERILIKEGIK